jgi:hypothetical protein
MTHYRTLRAQKVRRSGNGRYVGSLNDLVSPH